MPCSVTGMILSACLMVQWPSASLRDRGWICFSCCGGPHQELHKAVLEVTRLDILGSWEWKGPVKTSLFR